MNYYDINTVGNEQSNVFRIITNIFRSILVCTLLLVLYQSCTDGNQPPIPDPVGEAAEAVSEVPGIKSFVISHKGQILSENYFNDGGPDPDPVLHVMSATKSIISLLTGIALEMGFLDSVEQRIGPFLSKATDNVPKEFTELTIEDLLTMRAGFRWAEIDEPTEYYDFANAPNQLEYILDKTIEITPGTVFDYSDGAAHLLSIVLTEAIGMATTDFADIYLFEPLGLEPRWWQIDRQSYTLGGIGLFIGARDMITIGEMVLHNGQHLEQQIVPADWIKRSTTYKTSTNNVVIYGPDYGYYWWIGEVGGHEYYYASGFGGQLIVIIDDLDLVIATTCDYRVSATEAGKNWYDIMTIIVGEIIPIFG